MLLGKVVGTVVASRKEPTLDGSKFLLVRGLDLEGKVTATLVVAVDAVGPRESAAVN
jgi:microcompartment protein CcmK/EutM